MLKKMERFRCCHSHNFAIEKERYKEEGLETQTSEDQVTNDVKTVCDLETGVYHLSDLR